MSFDDVLKMLASATYIEEIEAMQGDLVYYIPRLTVMFGFDQCNHAHQYDLWHHCLHTVLNLPRSMDDPML